MVSLGGTASYHEDMFPQHLPLAERQLLASKYTALPAEFKSKTGDEVVTPDNFDKWFATHINLSVRWVLQEQFSGSGRLSLTAHQQQLPVLFPVDLRYGWDLRQHDHRNNLDLVRERFKPLVKFSSPDCRLWTAMTNTKPTSEVNTDRKKELPMLEWLYGDNCQQAKLGLGYINENGLRSQIWTQSPLRKTVIFMATK